MKLPNIDIKWISGLVISVAVGLLPMFCSNPDKDLQVELAVMDVHNGKVEYTTLPDKDTINLFTCFEVNQEYFDKRASANILQFPLVLKRPGYNFIDKISYHISSSYQKLLLPDTLINVGTLIRGKNESDDSIEMGGELEVSDNLSLKHENNPIDKEYCIFNNFGVTNGFVEVIVFSFTINQSGYAPREYIIKNHVFASDAIDYENVTSPLGRMKLNGEISRISHNKPYIMCGYEIDTSKADYHPKTRGIKQNLRYIGVFKNRVFNYFYYHPYFYPLVFCVILLVYLVFKFLKRDNVKRNGEDQTQVSSRVNTIIIIVNSLILIALIYLIIYLYRTIAEESWMPFLF